MKTTQIFIGALSILFVAVFNNANALILSGDLTSSGQYTDESISTQGTTTIKTGAYVELEAQTFIEIGPGFQIEDGGKLKITVTPPEPEACISVGSADPLLTGNVTSCEYYINGEISTQGTTSVNPGVTLKLYAEETVSFYEGFKVELGGVLLAVASPDSDGDLILDFVETEYGCSNPELADSDGDLLSDSEEDENHNGVIEPQETSPCNKDTDGDKMDDYWERKFALNPKNASDSQGDPDEDGLTNYMEYYFRGDDPENPASDPTDTSSLPPKGTYYEYDELGRVKKIIRIK